MQYVLLRVENNGFPNIHQFNGRNNHNACMEAVLFKSMTSRLSFRLKSIIADTRFLDVCFLSGARIELITS